MPMNTTTLAVLISLAMLIQLMTFAAIGWRRRQQQFLRLGQRTPATGELLVENVPSTPNTGGRAWEGSREFVVSRREIEDANAQICSF